MRSTKVTGTVDRFSAYHEWFLDAVETGIRDADAGRIVTTEDLAATFASWGVTPPETPTRFPSPVKP